ncbi:Uncharacterised protein [uncultured archaeon]|nr:Uncharacterised protein [uncultured archaeon]
MARKKILVLTVDYDDDLYQKTKIKGPLIGREENLKGAQELAIADPQDSDSNTMFQAIKICDELSKQKNVEAEVATITGDKKLGFKADSELNKQLELVLTEVSPDSCVFVGDGASDEQILPVIQSRIKIESVKTVTIKQSKELEKTYFVILEKLKDPHYARMILGIPGLLLLSFFLFNTTGLRYALGLIGIYLIVKGFGIEEKIIEFTKNTLNVKNIKSIFTIASIPIFIIGIWLSISVLVNSLNDVPFYSALGQMLNQALTLIPLGILLIIIGGIIEAFKENKKIELFDYANKITMTLLVWLFLSATGGWLVGNNSFETVITDLFLSILIITCTSFLFSSLKHTSLNEIKLIGKDVFNKYGHYIGKITIQENDTIEVKNSSGKYLRIPIEKIDFNETIVVAQI